VSSPARPGQVAQPVSATDHGLRERRRASELVAEYTEIESGKRADRPELEKALEACRRQRATLVIAKLGRLSRNVAFVATIMDSGVAFVACDNPHANKLTIHILAAVAQHEREMISERTRAALQAAKARGQKLGNPRIAKVATLGREARRVAADQFAANVLPVIRELQAAGATSANAIAAGLNIRKVPARRGGRWTHLSRLAPMRLVPFSRSRLRYRPQLARHRDRRRGLPNAYNGQMSTYLTSPEYDPSSGLTRYLRTQ
jgi:DNA invertase Pin-like site-specific DNA recombinase